MFKSVIDIHHEVTVMMKWSSVWVQGFGILPVVEQCQQVAPPHLAIFLEAHRVVASRLSGGIRVVVHCQGMALSCQVVVE